MLLPDGSIPKIDEPKSNDSDQLKKPVSHKGKRQEGEKQCRHRTEGTQIGRVGGGDTDVNTMKGVLTKNR